MKNIIAFAQEKEGTKFIVNQKELDYNTNCSYPIESLILNKMQ
jgi:hypothetical protein